MAPVDKDQAMDTDEDHIGEQPATEESVPQPPIAPALAPSITPGATIASGDQQVPTTNRATKKPAFVFNTPTTYRDPNTGTIDFQPAESAGPEATEGTPEADSVQAEAAKARTAKAREALAKKRQNKSNSSRRSYEKSTKRFC
jgi:hypothetical protein